MITDTLQNLGRYRGIHPNLDTAIRWLATHDVAALPNGRTDVDGDRVFLNVMDADLRPAGDAAFEVHRRYADLQLDLTGGERWGWADSAAPQGAPDAQKDIGFLTGPEQAAGVLGGGRFVLFLPGEPHKPSCLAPGCTHLRKAVVKIEMR
ncbi:YhcH/YjgK/YiaL family protein [bacterium]|uniref:YhcH/YjgK/YiaL family protein n=1 Tax=Gemmiger sp. TaxID=2049027 RepID=UPI002A7F7F3A|nr:YhcH/YjgK/YiaL family protein [Gemmiger sp.]MCI5556811.1 YhcH/YjgK/YiaL family protein [bacterium]MCI6082536.1 YhcH/YjgK/YiaL family protein [bacterium]MCI6175182.1 YhcH/YjgK/YiaL family protein [bacterium]MCI6248310.1 YhcH/YjgK/YiaL family protein [bacterium]MCI6521157.1 YhcH/YjgK/YiaL family protein [bacterium]